ncbi:MAG: hypothetical protein MAG453_00804 [Calditrichaeota bacterium]|nr:hypothetical protein [Calditrichota bacterium]
MSATTSGRAAVETGAARVHGALARFSGPGELLRAAEEVRDAGYREFDCHSPFPIHGMDAAMGEKRSRLSWFVAACALFGFAGAVALQTWTSVDALPVVVAGKPFFSHVAFFPITFALTVLCSVVGAVVGLTFFIRQQYTHPVFHSDSFSASGSDDGFFISVLAVDGMFDREATAAFLREIGGTNVELLEET